MAQAESHRIPPDAANTHKPPGGGQPAPEIASKLLPYAWIITGIVVVAIAAAGWWLIEPKAHAIEAAPTPIVATAPPAANPKPLNADGAPRSD